MGRSPEQLRDYGNVLRALAGCRRSDHACKLRGEARNEVDHWETYLKGGS